MEHNGGTTRGEYACSLVMTDPCSGWTEVRAVRNKAQVWVFDALQYSLGRIPFQVDGLHSDGGSEFINAHLERFCKERGIIFTRSRAYNKNDAPYVESKNWSMVRVYAGYRRYNTEEERRILRAMMRLVSIKHNLFIPTMKLIEKRRDGRRLRKRYSVDTPFARLLDSQKLSDAKKTRLVRMRECCNYFRLIEAIATLAKKLDRAYNNKYHPKEAA